MRRKTWTPQNKIQTGPGIPANSEETTPWNGSGFHACFELEDLDLDSKIGRSMVALKSYLRVYVGQGNVLTELLIGRITYKIIKLGMYESACLNKPQNVEAPHYLPMSNSLRLDLRSLADLAGETKPPDLSDYLEMKNAKDANGGAETPKMKRNRKVEVETKK